MTDPQKISELAGHLFGLVRKRTGRFLDENSDAKAFLADRTHRLAKLTLELAAAPDDAARTRVKDSIETVGETIDTELLSVANNALPEAKSAFKDTLKALFGFTKEILPVVLKSVLKM